MDTGWIVGLIVITVGLLVAIVGVLLVLFESKHLAALEEKEWTIMLLQEQMRMAKAYEEACKIAGQGNNEAAEPERKALALLAGPPRLLEMFLYLTDHVSISFQWDPSTDQPRLMTPGRPTLEEIQRNAAILILWDQKYISGALPAGFDEYSMVASGGAMAVRAAYDRLPESFKTRSLQQEQRP